MQISFEEFKKIEIRIGKVVEVEKVENADKLLKLIVDFGDFKLQIVAGIAEYYQPSELEGKKLPFIVNLEHRTIKGVESQGMLMAVDVDGRCFLFNVPQEVPVGSTVK